MAGPPGTPRGTLARLGESYGERVRWMLLEGHDLGPEPAVEQYLRNPVDTRPEDLETVIAIRIA